MDYRKFLAKEESIVLPYFGGTTVDSLDRKFRVDGEARPGWYEFAITGRRAKVGGIAPPTDLARLPLVRGHWCDGWIVESGRALYVVPLAPPDEPAALSRVSGRRWVTGEVLFDSVEFEDDAELAARDAYENRRPLAGAKGVSPSLRVAFGIALGRAFGWETGAEATHRELAPQAIAIADHGRPAFEAWLATTAAARERAAAEARERVERARIDRLTAGARPIARNQVAWRRAEEALVAAGARMMSCRELDGGRMLDVTCMIDGTRIIATVDAESLQVLDAGVCLDGADRAITLDSLPSVVREAISIDALNITRR